jgi:hypothetical protein
MLAANGGQGAPAGGETDQVKYAPPNFRLCSCALLINLTNMTRRQKLSIIMISASFGLRVSGPLRLREFLGVWATKTIGYKYSCDTSQKNLHAPLHMRRRTRSRREYRYFDGFRSIG